MAVSKSERLVTGEVTGEKLNRPLALFVYGTLAPGQVNEHILARLSGTWLPARVVGSLHQSGWGSEHGFPGLRLPSNEDSQAARLNDTVEGFLFASPDLADAWSELDAFEGSDYRCEVTTALLPSGKAVACAIYTVVDESCTT